MNHNMRNSDYILSYAEILELIVDLVDFVDDRHFETIVENYLYSKRRIEEP